MEYDAIREYLKEHYKDIETIYILNRKYRLIDVKRKEKGWIEKELTGFSLEYIFIGEI